MKIAIITAGGAGMFCGSCMQDNTLARALRMAGDDAVLVPTYTPIRVDEENVSNDQVFLGGVNVYLDSTVPGWKRLPGWMTHWLDRPRLISWITKFGASTDASKLGPLTLDMLRGNHGPQQRAIREFVDYLCNDLKPDLIIFSNALLSGVLTELRPRYAGKILCLLQGDDIFLEELSADWKQPVLQQMQNNCQAFDGFLTHSRYYQDFMIDYLKLTAEKFRQIPLTIDSTTIPSQIRSASPDSDRFRIGYFARICPQKGVQNLLSAAADVLPSLPNAEIVIAGFLPEQHRPWFEQLLHKATAIFPGRIHWLGSPAERSEKFQILRDFDVLCVPTDYHEPKGLYVLEAAVAGIPSIVPGHGAFPELIAALGHGSTYDVASRDGLVQAILTAASQEKSATTTLPDRVESGFGISTTGKLIATILRSLN
jgi:glycosyltransferase involved in cell wall biosynthesis